jgi:hypothetical protein
MSTNEVPEKAPWVLRRTVGVVIRRLMLVGGRILEGVQVPAVYLPGPGLDAVREAAALRVEIERLTSFAGPLAEHPLLGRMSPSHWERFHCIHCAHHLSFAVPK